MRSCITTILIWNQSYLFSMLCILNVKGNKNELLFFVKKDMQIKNLF